jgi:hypothetical protein
MFTNDVSEAAVIQIKKRLLTMERGDIIVRKLDGRCVTSINIKSYLSIRYDSNYLIWCVCVCVSYRLKSVLKSLTSIGGHLSQSKEYRDIYDDILNIVSFFCALHVIIFGLCITVAAIYCYL